MLIIVLTRAGQWVRKEGNLDVGVWPLWTNEGGGIRFAHVEFTQHICFGIATLCRVAPDLPAAPELLRWIEKDAHAVGTAHLLPVEAEEALDNEERAWNDVLWGPKVAQFVLVVGLQDGFSRAHQAQMLRHHVQ